jgi:hypothetical protein
MYFTKDFVEIFYFYIQESIQLMAKFTVESLQMWQFAPNSIHYLLRCEFNFRQSGGSWIRFRCPLQKKAIKLIDFQWHRSHWKNRS